jgi:hypothetical protein
LSLELKLGTAKIDITPTEPLPLAGFSFRSGEYEAITRPLYARILYFQQENGHNRCSALVVSADLIWWGTERVEKLKLQIHDKWGIDTDAIILHGTHNHSGPQTSNMFPALGKVNHKYIELLERRLLEGIQTASLNLEYVTVERGTGECLIGINRRMKVGNQIIMAPNEAGPSDPEVNVIRYRTVSGRTKALMVHYTCHPTINRENRVSSDFIGMALNEIENALGGETVAAYLQGCCGDINPALIRKGEFYASGKDREVCELGKRLAKEVLNVANCSMRSLPPSFLSVRKATIELAFQTLPDANDLRSNNYKTKAIADWARLLIEEPWRLQSAVPLEITRLDIADGLSLLTINAEVVVEYGLFVKSRSSGKVLPIGYSNGMIGYVPTAKQIKEGGYEAGTSIYYFGLPAPFDYSIESKVYKTMKGLL